MFSNGCLDLSVNLLVGNMVLVQNVQKPFGSISSQMPAFSVSVSTIHRQKYGNEAGGIYLNEGTDQDSYGIIRVYGAE